MPLGGQGPDPAGVGIIWAIKLIVGETKAEADALRERLITTFRPRRSCLVVAQYRLRHVHSSVPLHVGELQDIIVAANASPLGVVGLLMREHGAAAEFTRDEFMEHGLRQATGYNSTHTERRRNLPICWKNDSRPEAAGAAS